MLSIADFPKLTVSGYFEGSALVKITLAPGPSFQLQTASGEPTEAFIAFLHSYAVKKPFHPALLFSQTFKDKVLEKLFEIPFGETLSYGSIAKSLGAPKSARGVGTICRTNVLPLLIPCHRVIGSNGNLTGFAYGLEMKRSLLDFERSANSIYPILPGI